MAATNNQPLVIRTAGQKAQPGPTTKTKGLTFTDLAPELREQILELCDLRWDRRVDRYTVFSMEVAEEPKGPEDAVMPAIIVALRPQPSCYHQALDMFYRQSYYKLGPLTRITGGKDGPMSANALSKIQTLHLSLERANDIKPGAPNLEPTEPQLPHPLTPDAMLAIFSQTAISKIHMTWNLDGDTDANLPNPLLAFPEWLRAFRSLRRLTIRVQGLIASNLAASVTQGLNAVAGDRGVVELQRYSHTMFSEPTARPTTYSCKVLWKLVKQRTAVVDWSEAATGAQGS